MLVEISIIGEELYIYPSVADLLYYIEMSNRNPWRIFERVSPLLF